MTKVEIINDTVKHYSTHLRGKVGNSSTCIYLDDKTGAMCAFGRACIKKGIDAIKKNGYISHSIGDICDKMKKEIDFFLKTKYKGHSLDFWRKLQNFHDLDEYWEKTTTGNILTSKGKDELEFLLQKYEGQ